ncbi:MAG: ATP-binding protein [Sphingomicrobium sp.]
MDAPLLALTRRTSAAISGHTPTAATVENMRQLIQLRWIAVGGQLLAILVTHYGLDVPLPLLPMLGVVGLLVAANLLFALTLRRVIVRGELSLSLLLDMAALTTQLYLSGGSENPFISLYLLQVVLGAILLPPIVAGLMTLAACGFYALLSLQSLPLVMPQRIGEGATNLMVIGHWLAFAMVAVLLVMFIARISRNLRARDTYVAELGQRATEEEGIVRMGLFASGAAHELGTPLSTLSVLVADWQRLPAFRDDAALSEEIQEAKAEIERCKGIVTNILRSVGQTRGEAMQSVHARHFVEDLAAAWNDQHRWAGLVLNIAALGEARIVAEPALRQAIWSLLDNAVEASDGPVEIEGRIDGERVSLAILDRGPGFTQDQLHHAGQLNQSTKGPGHGLGLFLAGNVARQLEGLLEVANRDGGGAVLTLTLPLASHGSD